MLDVCVEVDTSAIAKVKSLFANGLAETFLANLSLRTGIATGSTVIDVGEDVCTDFGAGLLSFRTRENTLFFYALVS